MREYLGYFVLGYAVLLLLFSVFVQTKVGDLLDAMNQHRQQFGLTSAVPDWYFVFALSRCRYAPARALYKTTQPPLEVAQAFPNYKQLRCLGCAVWFAHIGLGILIVLVFILLRVLPQ
ncbi:hypothetical protein ACLPHM_03885 [Paenalcaligenes sp. Me131]|uniref:hypothetical protein n=1 Tax=Paenalcaligenes sp. Me131 TaxID=3392636 RepID=UPI003D2AB311